LGHYWKINSETAGYYILIYYQVVLLSMFTYVGGWYDVMFGMGFSTTALVIQEVVGHKMGGDPPSRIEGIPNAILYAIYFSTDSAKRILLHRDS